MESNSNSVDESNESNERQTQEWVSPPAYFSAKVWEHFKLAKDKSSTLCVHCKTIITYKNSNTSGMTRHVTRNNPTIELKPKRNPAQAVTVPVKESKQPEQRSSTLLSTYFSVIRKGSPRDTEITNALTRFIVKDLR